MFVQLFPFSKWFGIGFAVLSLYGPVVGPHGDRNGWRYLLGPLVCPLLVGVYFRLFPRNPYRGYWARIGGLTGLDRRDANASRLVEMFRSKGAPSYVWRVTVQVSLIEFTTMMVVLVAATVTGEVGWTMTSPWLWQGLLGCSLGSFVAVGSDVFANVLRAWTHSVAS
jgi:hypothetical protein